VARSAKQRQLNLFSDETELTPSPQPPSTPSPMLARPPLPTSPEKSEAKPLERNRNSGLTFHLSELPEQRIESELDLQRLRERKNLSLDDVFSQTRIPTRHLLALEAGDRSFLPPINVRAFLRTLARFYDVDWQRLDPPLDDTGSVVEFKTLDEVVLTPTVGNEPLWKNMFSIIRQRIKLLSKRLFSRRDEE